MDLKSIYALPIAPAPDMEIPQYLERPWTRWDGSVSISRYPNRKYTARVIEAGDKLLEITGYSHDNIPLWRTWQNHSRVLGQTMTMEPKPSESTVASRLHECSGKWYTTPENNEIIRKWLGIHYTPEDDAGYLRMVGESQVKIRHKKRDERWDRIRREVDNVMLEIRDLPKDFMSWVTKFAFAENHYIIYIYNKAKTTRGYCTRCRHEVAVKDPRNRMPGRCPRCHSSITYLSQKTLAVNTGGTSFHKCVAYLQSTSEGFCARYFSADMTLHPDSFMEMDAKVFEIGRSFFVWKSGCFDKRYVWQELETSGTMCWCQSDDCYHTAATIYPNNLKSLFQHHEPWKYIPMAGLARHSKKPVVRYFVTLTKEDASIEHLIKNKFYKLASERLGGKQWGKKELYEARSIREVLKLPMDEIRLLRQFDPSVREYMCYQELRMVRRITLQDLQLIRDNDIAAEREQLQTMLQYMSLQKIVSYAQKQSGFFPLSSKWSTKAHRTIDVPCSVQEVLVAYADYIADCRGLGWNLNDRSIVMPQNLYQAHQQTIAEIKSQADEAEARQIAYYIEKQAPLSYSNKELCIRPPVSRQEIVEEGQALHHCVGNYAGSVAKGKTIILFIRKKEYPLEPFCTLELNPDDFSIRQVRAKRNATPSEEVTKFLEQWRKHLKRIGGPDVLKERVEIKVAG